MLIPHHTTQSDLVSPHLCTNRHFPLPEIALSLESRQLPTVRHLQLASTDRPCSAQVTTPSRGPLSSSTTDWLSSACTGEKLWHFLLCFSGGHCYWGTTPDPPSPSFPPRLGSCRLQVFWWLPLVHISANQQRIRGIWNFAPVSNP